MNALSRCARQLHGAHPLVIAAFFASFAGCHGAGPSADSPSQDASLNDGAVVVVQEAGSADDGSDAHKEAIDDAAVPSPDGTTPGMGTSDSGTAGDGDGGRDAGTSTEGGDASDAGRAGRATGFAVGTALVEIEADAGRTVPVQLWYPAVEAARAEAMTGHPTEDFEPAGAHHDKLVSLLQAAPTGCTSKTGRETPLRPLSSNADLRKAQARLSHA